MKTIRIAPIVEGHGEDSAIRTLLDRTWSHLGGDYLEVLKPIRRNRGSLLKHDDPDLANSIEFALRKLGGPASGIVLILIDAEDDCAKRGSLGPLLLNRARAARPDADIECVIANVMFETWFVGAAESLSQYIELTDPVPEGPEVQRAGKTWIKRRMRNGKYSETIDQAKLAAAFDLPLCRKRCRSFDKLCRVLESRLMQGSSTS